MMMSTQRRKGAKALMLVSLCLGAFAFTSSAQQTPPSEGVIRINVNLVQVDAIVTDNKGKPVTDLTADDFELLQDGKPQVITNFAFINVAESRVTAPFVPTPKPVKGPPPPPPPPMTLRPDQIRRTVALVVDDLGLSFDSTVRVRESLKRWVEREMQPGDLVAVIRTSAGMGSLQQFTSDKRVLNSAIDLVRYQLGRVGVSSFAPLTAKMPASVDLESNPLAGLGNRVPPSGPIDTSVFDDQVAEAYTLGSIGAIQYVIQGLRDLPGRKSVVLFSESMRFTYLNGPGMVQVPVTSAGMVEQRLKRLTDAANRSSVVIYAIDPRGVVNTMVSAEDTTAGRTAEEIAAVSSQRTQELIASQDGMIVLSQKTGGMFLANNDIQGSLKQVVDDGNGYYLLGYQPDAETFEQTRVPKFHNISVRVKRKGLNVRSRTGFFGTQDGMRPPPVGRAEQLTRAFASPFTTGALRVRLTTLFSHDDKKGPYINALMHFDARDLTFVQEADGSRKAEIDTVAVTFDVDGQPVDSADRTWVLRAEEQKLEDVMRNGLIYSIHVPVKKAGAYQMRMVLRDAISEQVGSASQFIEVPDVKKGRLALSGIVLAAEKPQTAAAAGPAEGAVADQDTNGSAAVRIFKAGTPMVYVYQILNARTDKQRKPQLEVQSRLFREGQQVYASAPSALIMEAQQDPKHLIGYGRLHLTKAAPGYYALQVIVTDKLAGDKYKIAAQSMDFEIR